MAVFSASAGKDRGDQGLSIPATIKKESALSPKSPLTHLYRPPELFPWVCLTLPVFHSEPGYLKGLQGSDSDLGTLSIPPLCAVHPPLSAVLFFLGIGFTGSPMVSQFPWGQGWGRTRQGSELPSQSWGFSSVLSTVNNSDTVVTSQPG